MMLSCEPVPRTARIVNEPTAAAIAYGLDTSTIERTEKSEAESEGGTRKVGEGSQPEQRRKSGESARSAKKRAASKSKQSRQSARESTRIQSPAGSRLSNRHKKQIPGKSEFNQLELP